MSTVGTGAAATSRMTYWFERIPAAALKKPIPPDGALVRVEASPMIDQHPPGRDVVVTLLNQWCSL